MPEVPLHVMQRGHHRQCCFVSDADYLKYLDLLKENTSITGCQLHAYVLMSNHVHLLLTVADAGLLGKLMKAVGQEYAQYFNYRFKLSGAMWEGRYKACHVTTETYFMECQRYIELNPVRAGIAAVPGSYRWSSYRCNAEGMDEAMITPHILYQRLGATPLERLQAYRRLFDEPLAEIRLDRIRSAINSQRRL